MKNRIETVIEKAQNEGRVAFIGLSPIDPDSMEKTVEIADALVASGVDILMVHVPNWFPWMEGDILQKAARAPRVAGVKREDIFSLMALLRKKHPDLPLIVMTLYDTVLTMGQEKFLRLSKEADVDGFDIPNYPLFYMKDRFGFYEECKKAGKHLILAISYELATSEESTDEYTLLCSMAEKAGGFAFVMNAPGGQSGSSVKLSEKQLRDAVTRVKDTMKQRNNDCYIAIVCGISGKEDIDKVKSSGAESFMIGSAYIKFLQQGKPLTEVSDYIKGIHEACRYEGRKG